MRAVAAILLAAIVLMVSILGLVGCETLRTQDVSSHSCSVTRKRPVAENVRQFLLPTHKQFTAWAGLVTIDLEVPGHRIKVYGEEEIPCVSLASDGTQHVGLTKNANPPEGFEAAGGPGYIYEYTHELGHILSNHEDNRDARFKWFEETLSELASFHILHANEHDSLVSAVIGKHAAKRAAISDFDGLARVSEWFSLAEGRMQADGTIRELNGAIACELLPHFEDNPQLWEAVTYLNKWDAQSSDFRAHLNRWERRLSRRGLGSAAPDIVRAVLYGEGNISEPPEACNLPVEPQNAASALSESMQEYDREIAQERATVHVGVSGTGAGGGGGAGDTKVGSTEPTEPKIEIPVYVARTEEDPVARQIREAAEQEKNPRLREALWEEYRRHTEGRSE